MRADGLFTAESPVWWIELYIITNESNYFIALNRFDISSTRSCIATLLLL